MIYQFQRAAKAYNCRFPARQAPFSGCGCEHDEEAVVAKNGESSNSEINSTDSNVQGVGQGNEADVATDLTAEFESGDNEADNNTGEEAWVSVRTGRSSFWASVVNTANNNWTRVR